MVSITPPPRYRQSAIDNLQSATGPLQSRLATGCRLSIADDRLSMPPVPAAAASKEGFPVVPGAPAHSEYASMTVSLVLEGRP
jgi:hypothetical protein